MFGLTMGFGNGSTPPAAGGAVPLQVWNGVDRPADIVLTTASQQIVRTVGTPFVGYACCLGGGCFGDPGSGVRLYVGSTMLRWVDLSVNGADIERTYRNNSGVSAGANTTFYGYGGRVAIGVLLVGTTYRVFAAQGGVLYTASIPSNTLPSPIGTIALESENFSDIGQGLVVAQEWFKGDVAADAYPTSNIVSDWVVANGTGY